MKRCALERRTPLKRKGKERGEPMPALRAWIRQQPCALSGRVLAGPVCRGKTQPAHLPRVKQHGDIRNLIPLCKAHHDEQHGHGRWTFARKYALELQELADGYWDRYQESAHE